MELKQFSKENTIILEFLHFKAFGRQNVHTTDDRDDRVSDKERKSEEKKNESNREKSKVKEDIARRRINARVQYKWKKAVVYVLCGYKLENFIHFSNWYAV